MKQLKCVLAMKTRYKAFNVEGEVNKTCGRYVISTAIMPWCPAKIIRNTVKPLFSTNQHLTDAYMIVC